MAASGGWRGRERPLDLPWFGFRAGGQRERERGIEMDAIYVENFEILMGVCEGKPAGKLRFVAKGEDGRGVIVESGVYPPHELSQMVLDWKAGGLTDEGFDGTVLNHDAWCSFTAIKGEVK